jgi:adenylate cyclase
MNAADANGVYRFEEFVLDLRRGALLRATGEEVPLRRKSFELLCIFVANAGRLLDRDTLSRAVWPDVIVADDAVTQCVREIRRALGDDAQRMIRTVQRRGYTFSTEVRHAPDSVELSGKPSIAVLPFANLSGDPGEEYFSDAIADDIITELSRNRLLLVIARNSSFTYKAQAMDTRRIARELGVRYLVEGSVRRSCDRVRVNANLVDAAAGVHLWADRFDRETKEIFAVQDEITARVTAAILPAVIAAEQSRVLRKSPDDLGTWDLYHQAMWHYAKLTAADNEAARALFARASELDPMFAAAHTALSRVHLSAGNVFTSMPRHEAIELGCRHARKAVELDAADAEAHAALALALFYRGDMDDALTFARQALAINPNCAHAYRALGLILIFTGRMAEGRDAVGVFTRLSPRDPGIPATISHAAMAYYFEGDYEQCVSTLRRQLGSHPHYTTAYRWLAAALGQLGRSEEARDALRYAIADSPSAFELYVGGRPPWFHLPEQYAHFLDGLRKAGWQG